MNEIRAAVRAAKNTVLQFSDIEVKVREATSNDPWGPSSTIMSEIARATHNYHDYPQLFHRLWERLNDVEHVMHVQKSLILVDYLLRNGAERFINDCKRRARDIAQLQRFRHYDANNNDDAREARHKAKLVYELLMNDKVLAEERAKAKKIMDVKTQGFGGGYDDGGFGGGSSGAGYGGSGYGGGGSYDDVGATASYHDPTTRSTTSFDDGGARRRGATADTTSASSSSSSSATTTDDGAATTEKKKKKKIVKKKTAHTDDAPAAAAAAPAEDAPKKKKKDGEKKKKKKKEGDGEATVEDPFASTTAPAAAAGDDPFASSSSSSAPSNNRTATQQYNDFLSSSASSSSSSSSSASNASGEEFLESLHNHAATGQLFANSQARGASGAGAGGDVDILTGGVGGLSIVDMFQQHHHNNHHSKDDDDDDDDDDEEDESDEENDVFAEMKARKAQEAAAAAAAKADPWSVAAELTNLDNITQQDRPQKKKQIDDSSSGLSMATMRSMQPLGAEKHTVVVPPPVAQPTMMMVSGAGMGVALPPNSASSTALVLVPQQPAGYPYGAPGMYGMPTLGHPAYGVAPPALGGGYSSPFPAPPQAQAPIRTAPHYGGQGGAPTAQQLKNNNSPFFDVPRAAGNGQ